MTNVRHPNFILGAIAVLTGAVALGLNSTRDHQIAPFLMIVAFALGVIHWIWSIIDVYRTDSIVGGQKVFWLIGVIAIPIGGMLYYFLHSKRDTIVD